MPEITLSAQEFKSLSSENRVKILKLLDERNHTLTELAKKLSLSSPSTKQHLGVLLENRLVELIDEGRKWKYYSLTRKGKQLVKAKETETTVLIVLSVASVAFAGVLLMLLGSIGLLQQPALTSNASDGRAFEEIGIAEETVKEAAPLASPVSAGEDASFLLSISLVALAVVIIALVLYWDKLKKIQKP